MRCSMRFVLGSYYTPLLRSYFLGELDYDSSGCYGHRVKLPRWDRQFTVRAGIPGRYSKAEWAETRRAGRGTVRLVADRAGGTERGMELCRRIER